MYQVHSAAIIVLIPVAPGQRSGVAHGTPVARKGMRKMTAVSGIVAAVRNELLASNLAVAPLQALQSLHHQEKLLC